MSFIGRISIFCSINVEFIFLNLLEQIEQPEIKLVWNV